MPTFERVVDPSGGTLHLEGAAVFEKFKLNGDGTNANVDIKLGANRRIKSVRIRPGNVVVAGFATTLNPSASVDVRVNVPAGLAANQYAYLEVELYAQ